MNNHNMKEVRYTGQSDEELMEIAFNNAIKKLVILEKSGRLLKDNDLFIPELVDAFNKVMSDIINMVDDKPIYIRKYLNLVETTHHEHGGIGGSGLTDLTIKYKYE